MNNFNIKTKNVKLGKGSFNGAVWPAILVKKEIGNIWIILPICSKPLDPTFPDFFSSLILATLLNRCKSNIPAFLNV